MNLINEFVFLRLKKSTINDNLHFFLPIFPPVIKYLVVFTCGIRVADL